MRIFALTLALSLTACVGKLPQNQAVLPPKPDLSDLWENLPAQMEQHKLAGLALAIFDGYQIVEQRTFGHKVLGSEDPVRSTTAFSTASISKPITALLCLILEAEGRFDVDAPIAQYLERWQLPQSQFALAHQVTARQLLAHRGGTSQHGFADFYEGDTVPTLIDSLQGRLPRYDKPIEFLFEPGSDWKYSGGGYVIVQLAIEDHLQRSLAELAAEKIFRPLRMTHTTMIQPGETGFPVDAAKVHDETGEVIKTGLPITPQIAASGMWSTPTDLAKFAIAIQRALNGGQDSVITPAMAQELTDIASLDHVGGMGMPFFRGFGFGNIDWFRHDGSNTGVNSDLMAAMDGGFGVVLMGNGDDANTAPVFAQLRDQIITRMRWSELNTFDEVELPASLQRAVVGTFKGLLYDLGLEYRIEKEGDDLWIHSDFFTLFLGRPKSKMVYLGNNEFAILDFPNRIRFELDTEGSIDTVTLFRLAAAGLSFTRPIADLRD